MTAAADVTYRAAYSQPSSPTWKAVILNCRTK